MEDSEIIDLYWQRNEAAITETDRKYHNYLSVIAYNILNDHADSEECLEDTYLRTWNAIPPERPSMFSAWLSKVTRRLALDMYRKENRMKRKSNLAVSLEELGDTFAGKDEPQEQFAAKQLQEAIHGFLAGLPPVSRSLFLMRYYYMDSLKDAASYCGMSQAAAKSQLFRMRARLKDYLLEEGFEV